MLTEPFVWNRTPASTVIADVAFATEVEQQARRTTFIRLLLALLAHDAAWVGKIGVHNGEAPYLVFPDARMAYGPHKEKKVARVDVDALLIAGFLEDIDAPAPSYLGAALEDAYRVTPAARAIFATRATFDVALARVAEARTKQRVRRRAATDLWAAQGPEVQETDQILRVLGIRLVMGLADADAAFRDLPPSLEPLRDLLMDAKAFMPQFTAMCVTQNTIEDLRSVPRPP